MAIGDNASRAKTGSISVAETEEATHEFTITNYSFQKTKILKSANFKVGGYIWAIQLDPPDFSDRLSIYLVSTQKLSGVTARLIVSILDKSGKPSKCGYTIGPRTIIKGSEFGSDNILKFSESLWSECLLNDSLTIRCNLTVVTSVSLKEIKHCNSHCLSHVVPPAKLQMHLGNLLESGEESDVTFEVDGEIFLAHRLVLAARSPVFKAELLGPMKEAKEKTIVIHDMKAPVFKAMLHFIYWDCLPEFKL